MNIKVCPNCGTENDADFVACKRCGNDIDYTPVIDSVTRQPVPQPNREKSRSGGNSVAGRIKFFAIVIYIVGFVAGIYVGAQVGSFQRDESFSLPPALICWAIALVFGTMLQGYSEIVRLLHEINQKTKKHIPSGLAEGDMFFVRLFPHPSRPVMSSTVRCGWRARSMP